MVYFVRLSKSGGSLVIALPAPVRDALELGRGDQLALTVQGGVVLMAKLDDTKSDELVGDILRAKR